jgi:hypothetical protein
MRGVRGERVLRILAKASNVGPLRVDTTGRKAKPFRRARSRQRREPECGESRRQEGRVKMAKRVQLLRRTFLGAGALFVLGTVGCAFPHGSTSGDPLLGNFNRPIVPTPPPERGGLGLDSPAYDGGARIGVTAPDIPTTYENTSGFRTLPSLGSSSIFSNAKMPFSTPDDSTLARKASGIGGARLPSGDGGPRSQAAMPTYRPVTPRDPVNGITSAASFSPADPAPAIKLAGYEAPRDPAHMKSVEDGNAMLLAAGGSGQRMEQLSPTEWAVGCTLNSKVYEARGETQLDAMKKLVEKVQKAR